MGFNPIELLEVISLDWNFAIVYDGTWAFSANHKEDESKTIKIGPEDSEYALFQEIYLYFKN